MKTLFLAWQDPSTRAWFPIGKLNHDGKLYHFVYLQGAIQANRDTDFQPIISFPDFYKSYESRELFPLFQNRLLRPSRPDYPSFIQSINLSQSVLDPIDILSRTGGKRETDTFEVFPLPERDEQGNYTIYFLAHGISHFPLETHQHILSLVPGEQLYVMHDCQNPFDHHALMLRTQNRFNVGFCPRYLVHDFFKLLIHTPEQVSVTVEQINLPPTPIQSRMLCRLTARWQDNFQPFSAPIFEPLSSQAANALEALTGSSL
jgi:hypothetical protein